MGGSPGFYSNLLDKLWNEEKEGFSDMKVTEERESLGDDNTYATAKNEAFLYWDVSSATSKGDRPSMQMYSTS